MISKNTLLSVAAMAAGLIAGNAVAKVNVVTTTTDLAWAVQEIGGDLVSVESLLDGTENPHYVDAVPKFIQLVANADVVCMIGLDLEVGWVPKVLSKSGNAKVQPGGPGYCDASKEIQVLDKPVGAIDRSLGDVHPGGNPHYWLDPDTLAASAGAMAEVLVQVDAANAETYMKNLDAFMERMSKLRESIAAKITPVLKGLPKGPILVEYHSEFDYFLEAYGLKSLATIEEKPGVKPAAGRIASIAIKAKNAGIRFAIAAPYNPEGTLARFNEMSGIPVFIAPTSIQKDNEKLDSYEELQNYLADGIVNILTKGPVAGR